ncbi:MAG: hypothetical protein K6F95_04150 [Selenomonas sp.]|uniref:hypothetical protein n=1 Tax=Selenomonas sp. TaxID=2053611 RepID=UPI0025D607D3|nr:hypothetical protein [Selenomonas sp.]MCR5757079.1 hypothetical protein [Selenomonas sp.]
MAENSRDEGAVKGQRSRYIFVGGIVALAFVLLGAWLARDILKSQVPIDRGQVSADTGLIDWRQVLEAHPDYEKETALQAECDLLELECNDVGDMLTLQPPELLEETFKESVWQKNAADVIGGRAELERKAQKLRDTYKKRTAEDFQARRQALDEEYLNAILNINIKLDNQSAMHNPLDSKESIAQEREEWIQERSRLQAERGRRQYDLWQAYRAEIEAYVQHELGPELTAWRASLPQLKDQKMAEALKTKTDADKRNAEALAKQQDAALKVQKRLEKRQLLEEKKAELAALQAHIFNDVMGRAAKIAILHHLTLILVHHPQELSIFLPDAGVKDYSQSHRSVAIGITTQDVTAEIVQEMKNL